jgi:hemerythrin superfamily protein
MEETVQLPLSKYTEIFRRLKELEEKNQQLEEATLKYGEYFKQIYNCLINHNLLEKNTK